MWLYLTLIPKVRRVKGSKFFLDYTHEENEPLTRTTCFLGRQGEHLTDTL